MFTGVLNQIRVNHPDSMDSHAVIIAAIRGMLGEMDPHSYVLVARPLVAEKLEELQKGRLVPVPVSFQFVGGSIVVAGVVPGSSAARAGMLAGDELTAIEGKSVDAESADELDLILSGPKGSQVKLTVERQLSDGTRQSSTHTVKREKPEEGTAVPAAFMLAPGTGYLRITTFVGEKIADDVQSALSRLEREGLTRLVVDLRDNGGGDVKAAADVASLFLPTGSVVYSQEGRKSELNETVKVKRGFFGGSPRSWPVAVLVNEGTASASELVAGALQDHDRAMIVGRPTFGKSLVMRAFPLPDGSLLWMVVGRMKTPCGRVIQREYHGVTLREYYRLAAAARDTAGRPSCTTPGGRRVFGGGGIYPDRVLDPRPARTPWLSRVEASLVVTKWISGFLSQHPEIKDQRAAMTGSLTLPAGALADFRRFAGIEGLTVPEGEDPDRLLSRLLLPWLADAAWGEGTAYQIIARMDPEVDAARLTLDRR
jgi:carboxyl-terminal processing protease